MVLELLIKMEFSHSYRTGVVQAGSKMYEIIIMVCIIRDPNTSSTLDVIEQSLDWLKSGSYDDSDIAESKISVFSEVQCIPWFDYPYSLIVDLGVQI